MAAFSKECHIKNRSAIIFCILILIVFFTAACGLEEYYHLPPVPYISSGDISTSISLPNISSIYYATNFSIYYKIYLSNNLVLGTINTQGLRNNVSAQLDNDFRFFEGYTNISTALIPTTNLLFTGRNYYEIGIENNNIETLLSKENLFPPGATSNTITVHFDSAPPGYFTLYGNRHNLLRTNSFTPRPDRFFRDHDDLKNNSYAGANSTFNRDVLQTSSTGIAPYAYVSMYIITQGINQETFQRIYSKPTHIGIFRIQ